MTEDDIRALLHKMCLASSQREVARKMGVSEVFMHRIVKRNGPIGRKVPKALGLAREVKYIACKDAADME